MYSDPIADLLTRIRNANRAGKGTVTIPYSKIKEEVAKILEQQSIIEKTRIDRTNKFPEIIITFKPDNPTLNLRRVSKPGQRVYIKAADIKPVRNGFGVAVISTSGGLLTGEDAKVKGVGGEYICDIY